MAAFTIVVLRRIISAQIAIFRANTEEFGLMPTLCLAILFPDAWKVIKRIKRHILTSHDPMAQALSFRKSYIASFNMIGIAVRHAIIHTHVRR